jgi:CheY-like chemotaxis protein
LGLAIVRRLIDLMGGQVQLESLPVAGTTVTITLGLIVGADQTNPYPTLCTGRRVVIIEPDPIARDIVERYMTAAGVICVATPESAQGLTHLRQAGRHDLALIGLWPDDPSTQRLAERLAGDPVLARFPRLLIGSTAVDPTTDAGAYERGAERPLKRGALLAACAAAHTGAPGPARSDTATMLETNRTLTRPLILLAEDNVINRKVAGLQLERLGYAVEFVGDGAAAVAAYRADPDRFHLILMDCQMPVLDGFAATREIRDWETDHAVRRRIVVIAMTANAMAGDRDICLAAGMDDYLSKPVSRQALTDALARHDPATAEKAVAVTG